MHACPGRNGPRIDRHPGSGVLRTPRAVLGRLALASSLGAGLVSCEAGQRAHDRYDYTGVYTSRGMPVFAARFSDGSTLAPDAERSARVEVTHGASIRPTIRITYAARHDASARRFTIECSGRGTRTPEGTQKEFFTITSPRCSSAVGSCPMTVEAPILFRPRPVGSSARSGDWELGAADITVRLPLADGCDDVPERLLVDPLHGFSPS